MAKKIRNLKPDTVLKNYWNDKEQFADFFNAVLFAGKQIIKPEELEDLDTEESVIFEHGDYAESMQALRDGIRVRKKSLACGVELVMLGMESQEYIHYGMPIRIMGYDYGSYKKQYDANAKRYKSSDGMEKDEYLSRMKRTDKFVPVITVTVYYGEKPWDGAMSLYGLLDIPEEMKQFVNDYRMLLVEARQSQLTFHNVNNRDFFHMLSIVLNQNVPKNEAKETAIEYARKHQVDKTVIMTLAGATNCKIDYDGLAKKGDVDMCTLFDEIARESEMKGKAEGIIETCFDCGLSEHDILERLQEKLDVSLQMAEEYLRRFGKRTV